MADSSNRTVLTRREALILSAAAGVSITASKRGKLKRLRKVCLYSCLFGVAFISRIVN